MNAIGFISILILAGSAIWSIVDNHNRHEARLLKELHNLDKLKYRR